MKRIIKYIKKLEKKIKKWKNLHRENLAEIGNMDQENAELRKLLAKYDKRYEEIIAINSDLIMEKCEKVEL